MIKLNPDNFPYPMHIKRVEDKFYIEAEDLLSGANYLNVIAFLDELGVINVVEKGETITELCSVEILKRRGELIPRGRTPEMVAESVLEEEESLHKIINEKVIDMREEIESRQKAYVFEKHKPILRVKREQIKGIDSVLERMDGVVRYFKKFKDYERQGGRPSLGALLHGIPGAGKSMSSFWVATEAEAAGAQIIYTPDFPTVYEDTWTKTDIANIFKFMREYRKENPGIPVLVQWEDFENVSKEKSGENEANLVSQMRTEMDNWKKNIGIFILATTNFRREDLDDALLRPGRLYPAIECFPPDYHGLVELLKVKVKQAKHPAKGIDYTSLAALFGDRATGAFVGNLIRDADWLAAAKVIEQGSEKGRITNDDILSLLIENLMGHPLNIILSGEERYSLAVHEIGHAAVYIKLGMPVQLVTVRPSGYDYGKTISREYRKHILPIKDLKGQLCACYGGIEAEELLGIPQDTGRVHDIKEATKIANAYIGEMGITGELGPLSLELLSKDGLLSPNHQFLASNAMKKIMEEEREHAKSILKDYGVKKIKSLAETLVERVYLLQKDLDGLIK